MSYESDDTYEINAQHNSLSVSEHARRLGSEAYQAMLDAKSDGDVCIVEKSYVITGTPLQDQSLFFCGLQNLINMERMVSAVCVSNWRFIPFLTSAHRMLTCR